MTASPDASKRDQESPPPLDRSDVSGSDWTTGQAIGFLVALPAWLNSGPHCLEGKESVTALQ